MSETQDTMAAEEFKASFGDPSTAAEPTAPEGGAAKHGKDKKKAAEKADKVDTATPGQGAGVKEESEANADVEIVEEEVISIDESVAAMFEGMDISEDFKKKATLVFEAAVNEAASSKAQAIVNEKVTELETTMNEQVKETVDTMVENLDSYLDYVVEEWMTDNELAIESGIKVDMAESLMDGLRGLFEEHNIDVSDETIDVVAGLEEEVDTLKAEANKQIDENLELAKSIAGYRAAKVFDELSEDLTLVQQERLKVLSEKLDFADIEDYTSNLNILKESFFTADKAVTEEAEIEEEEIITEDTEVKKPASDYSSINALVEALNSKKS